MATLAGNGWFQHANEEGKDHRREVKFKHVYTAAVVPDHS